MSAAQQPPGWSDSEEQPRGGKPGATSRPPRPRRRAPGNGAAPAPDDTLRECALSSPDDSGGDMYELAAPGAAPAAANSQAAARRPGAGTRVDQYEIIRSLGHGGLGEVYLARDLRLGRLVALKRLTTSNPNVTKRFLREAQSGVRCCHENIVATHGLGSYRGEPYLVLEYLEGQTLRQWMRAQAASAGESAPVTPSRAVAMMLPVVRALSHAHARGIVHRDLKPENIMLTRAGSIKVLDFGIASLLEAASADESEHAASDALDPSSDFALIFNSGLGSTCRYMSPEQLGVGEVDHRSDIWAVGIILFELVTGRHPVPTGSTWELLSVADRDDPMPSVIQSVPDLRAELGPLASIIDRCLLKRAEHRMPSARALLAELEAFAPERGSAQLGEDGNPFAGLTAFQESDAGRFFGRDRDIDQVVGDLRSRPLVALAGPSGAGKSSLVRAGVIPALKRSGEGWDTQVLRPGRAPLYSLAALLEAITQDIAHSVADADASATIQLGDTLVDSASSAALAPLVERIGAEPGYLGTRLRAHASSEGRRLLIFVDQLEELFTLGAPASERISFLASLSAAADDPASPLRVLVAIRSDFIDRLTEKRQFGKVITRGLLLLPPMEPDGMRQALLGPLAEVDYHFESHDLVQRMVEALDQTSGSLPLLQFTAARLWELRDIGRRLLTEASYEQIGGVAGALATHADAVLADLTPPRQAVARSVFERLVTPERTRALVSVAELHTLHADVATVDEIIQHLTVMRLLVIERGERSDERMVELVHESLIERWPTLARWLDENQEDAAFLARLRAAARDWERNGRPSRLLWTGAAALEAQAWQQRCGSSLVPGEKQFLAAVEGAARRARRMQRNWAAVLAAAGVITLVAIALGTLAWQQSRASARAAALAQQERQARSLAAESAERAILQAERARDAARLAAVRAMHHDPTTQIALLREIEHRSEPPPGAAVEAKRLLQEPIARTVFSEHTGALSAVRFSPDGQRVASASSDATVRIWRVDGAGETTVLRGHSDMVTSVDFSPDGRRVASASRDKSVRVWRADGTGDERILIGHEGVVSSVRFSPDGRFLVSASEDASVRVWNADGTGTPRIFRDHDEAVHSAEFSPDGARIAATSADKTIRIWNADGSGTPLVLRGHEADVWTARFSPDGKRLVSTSYDNTMRIWNTDGSATPLVLRGHEVAVVAADFSPDGQRVVSASYDNSVRIWNADGTGTPLSLRGHDDWVMDVAFSPDGAHVVSASMDKSARIWPSHSSDELVVLRGHLDQVWSADFSPDGQRVVSASLDGSVRIWNADGTGTPVVLRGHENEVLSTRFSPDGKRVVSGSMDKSVRIWNSDGSGRPTVLRGHQSWVTATSFSPDGQRVLSTSADQTVRIWELDGSRDPVVLRGHNNIVVSASFSPDGQRVASASRDGTVRVWNADGSGASRIIPDHGEAVWSVSFSPDGRRLASASSDRTIRVWNAHGNGSPVILRGHEDGITSVDFSPDGQRILSGSKDKTIRIWNADGHGPPQILSRYNGAVHTAQFSPDGQSMVSSSDDWTVQILRDLRPVALEDPDLWTSTSYCLPVARRVALLGVDEELAAQNLAKCQQRVALARQARAAKSL